MTEVMRAALPLGHGVKKSILTQMDKERTGRH